MISNKLCAIRPFYSPFTHWVREVPPHMNQPHNIRDGIFQHIYMFFKVPHAVLFIAYMICRSTKVPQTNGLLCSLPITCWRICTADYHHDKTIVFSQATVCYFPWYTEPEDFAYLLRAVPSPPVHICVTLKSYQNSTYRSMYYCYFIRQWLLCWISW